jgi:hypothetical protein
MDTIRSQFWAKKALFLMECVYPRISTSVVDCARNSSPYQTFLESALVLPNRFFLLPYLTLSASIKRHHQPSPPRYHRCALRAPHSRILRCHLPLLRHRPVPTPPPVLPPQLIIISSWLSTSSTSSASSNVSLSPASGSSSSSLPVLLKSCPTG